MSKLLQLQKMITGSDKRHFAICPKCRSDKTNYIAVYQKISMFNGKKKTKSKMAVIRSKGLTLCRDCCYSEGSL